MAEEADLDFDAADAGASLTFPMQAGNIRKGGHLVVKGRPCKVRAPRTATGPRRPRRSLLPRVFRAVGGAHEAPRCGTCV